MNKRHRLGCIGTLGILVSAVGSRACLPVSPLGFPVRIESENAVIVWDEEHQIEHFVRQAHFETRAKDFGFLVPTPTVPILAGADERVFSRLTKQREPKPEERTRRGFYLTSWLWPGLFPQPNTESEQASRLRDKSAALQRPSLLQAGVQILKEQEVAGYTAVVLEAEGGAALQTWLREHGYASDQKLIDWIAPYVQKHWKITAFKFAKKNGNVSGVASSLVRLSFRTDRPFYPYRESEAAFASENAQRTRLLRVFFLSAAKVEGRVGEKVSSPNWSVTVPWADRIAPDTAADLARSLNLPPEMLPSHLWMTTLEDTAVSRPGKAEVYFIPATDQEAVVPPPIVHEEDARLPFPIELGGAGILCVGAGYGARRRRGRSGLSLHQSRAFPK